MRIYAISTIYKPVNSYQTQPIKRNLPDDGIDSISFGANIDPRFSKKFLKSLLNYGLPCPICRETLIPLEQMYEPASQSLKKLSKHTKDMEPTKQKIFCMLCEHAKQEPNKTIQQLLQQIHSSAERDLVIEQKRILDKLFLLMNHMTNKQKKEFTILYDKTVELMRTSNQKSKLQRFKRKTVINDFDDFALTLDDDKVRTKLMSTIRELPTSRNNVNAFIVKYSQRSSSETAMTLYRNDFGTLEHIIPDSQGGRIAIWECSEDNGERGDRLMNLFLDDKPHARENIQHSINRLIALYHSNASINKSKLKEYIFAVKNDYAIATKGKIDLDISNLGTIPNEMIEREIIRIEDMGQTGYLKKLYKMLRRNNDEA